MAPQRQTMAFLFIAMAATAWTVTVAAAASAGHVDLARHHRVGRHRRPHSPTPPPTPFTRPPAPPPSEMGAGAECVAPLAALMTCGTFLTGTQSEAPTRQSDCCTGLSLFLNSSNAAGDGDRTLRCLCPVILGDVNRMLPKPIDPVRMMYLPIACGVVLPPKAIYICFTGGQVPPIPPPPPQPVCPACPVCTCRRDQITPGQGAPAIP